MLVFLLVGCFFSPPQRLIYIKDTTYCPYFDSHLVHFYTEICNDVKMYMNNELPIPNSGNCIGEQWYQKTGAITIQ